MADRYENVGRDRFRDEDRERSWGRGRREGDFDRESRAEYLRGDYEREERNRGHDRDYDREGERRYGTEGRGRENDEFTRNLGGGMGSYSGRRDWESRGYGGGTGTSWERERTTGRFAGRGPKNYNRSDERIYDDVCDRLTRDPDVDASEIEVEVHDREVTLKGSVGDRDQKHRAEDVAERAGGVRDVHNHIKVDRSLMEKMKDTFGWGEHDDREERRRTLNVTGANPELVEQRHR